MREFQGDLWKLNTQAKCVTTNGVLNKNNECVMGRGCALEAKQRYPWLPKYLGYQIDQKGNVPFIIPIPDESFWLISFPVKHRGNEPADVELVKESARRLNHIAWWFNLKEILLPRPGCGNGHLDWVLVVKPILEPIFDDRFIILSKPGE